jgi:hypothetical protein
MLRRVALVRPDVSEECYRLHDEGDKNRRARNNVSSNLLRLLVTAKVVPSTPTPVTLMMEAISSSETSVPPRSTRRNIPEDGTLHSHRREKPQILHSVRQICMAALFDASPSFDCRTPNGLT